LALARPAKTFAERGIPFDCLERENDIGGLWNEATETGVVYDTTYLVSSRRYTVIGSTPSGTGSWLDRTPATVCRSRSIASWTNPTMDMVLPQLAAHGRIGVKPEITELKGRVVRFADGSKVEADLLVYATGYEIRPTLRRQRSSVRCGQAAPSVLPRLSSAIRRSLRRRSDPGEWQRLAHRG
jgi:cation diffusion facilitator CzcD-associated flavoprotein CzcO